MQDSIRLKLLKTTIDKYHDVSESMSDILSTFECRLAKLEEIILPVYNETENLQKRQLNLDMTLEKLLIVISHYESSQELCNLIHVGPSDGDIASFLGALNKLKMAKDYFLNNNTQSVELQNVTSLFNSGCETLNTYYRNVLRKHCNPITAVKLLDLICADTESDPTPTTAINLNTGMNYPCSETRDELYTISNWLDNNLRREYIAIYVEERSAVVLRSLKFFKDHQRSGSWGEHDPIVLNTAISSSVAQKGRAIGYTTIQSTAPFFFRKSASARLQAILEKKTSKMFQRVENTTGISIKKTGNANISTVGVSISADCSNDILLIDEHADGNDQDIEKYLMLLVGLQRLLLRERQLMIDVVPKQRHNNIFARLSQQSIEMVVHDAETISSRVLKSIARKEWSTALGVFSALKHLILLQPEIDQACDQQELDQLTSVQTTFVHTAMKTLEHFLGIIKCETSTSSLVGMTGASALVSSTSGSTGSNSVPPDATVHELTSNAIWFMEHLYEHTEVIGIVLQNNTLYTSQLIDIDDMLSTEDRNRALFGLYIKKVLAELNLTIVTKCEQYNDLATRILFRLNNIHYILKSMQRSKIIMVLKIVEPECEKYYEDLIHELQKAYQKSWARLLSHITPLEDLPRPINGRVKDKERAILKERFTHFNKDLEEAYKIQQSISIPDVILRNSLKRDNVENIIPEYKRFFQVYEDVLFSRHPEKYLKYRSEDVSGLLNCFFDDTV